MKDSGDIDNQRRLPLGSRERRKRENRREEDKSRRKERGEMGWIKSTADPRYLQRPPGGSTV
jgi:hypothetical protein